MTQEELNALLNSDVSELPDEEELQEEKEEAKEELSSNFRIDQEVNWPPPPPTNEHKVVHQLDDVTRDSEVKATETFDKLEAINNAGMDIEDSVKVISGFFKSQKELLEKLHAQFPDFHTFGDKLEELKKAQSALDTIMDSSDIISNSSLEAMDIMQYQDIHRQKIERVINVMRALSRYMSSLFEGRIDDSKRVSSAVHIQGDKTENVVNDDDIEALIANFSK
ncbi:chemotaxis protein [Helicobacter sp. WB40]|uniref:chemotaxis protein n=1 Tax=Helicobacter sp. WB40 TaxID=3004130 RepID=UPI0022EC035F|nr:chemotaxis protein [Helicobacter sp. WB40]MDA3967222.1 chemotaxis protein [Helicobacter sp. WB40]